MYVTLVHVFLVLCTYGTYIDNILSMVHTCVHVPHTRVRVCAYVPSRGQMVRGSGTCTVLHKRRCVTKSSKSWSTAL